MKIIVTGSEGYIGTVLTQKLLERGHDVVGVDAGFYRSAYLYNNLEKSLFTLGKDIRDITEKELRGFDALIHLAELSNDPLGQLSPDITYAINHEGTVELAKKAKKAGIARFIYSSSCSVYGASDEMSDERSTANPLTTYAKCKILNEQALSTMADNTFSPVILRNATVYGPSPRMRFDLVVNNLSGVAWITKGIKMESDGTPWRPFVHIEDVAHAFVCALEAPKESVHGQIFNVGDTRSNYQIKDIALIVSKMFPGCTMSLNKNAVDKRNYRVNFDKINVYLPGFACKKTVEDGVKELLEVFKKINMDKETFESRHFTRLKQINHLLETGQIDKEFYWR